MISLVIGTSINRALTPIFKTETFENETPEKQKEVLAGKATLVAFLTLVVILLLLLLVGQLLWNNVLVALFPFVKPAKSIWQILGLSLLLGLILPGCNCGPIHS